MPSRIAGWTKVSGKTSASSCSAWTCAHAVARKATKPGSWTRFDGCDAVLGRRHEREPLGLARECPADLLGPDRELVLAQRLAQLDLGRRRVPLVHG